jgi:hypothetical protein
MSLVTMFSATFEFYGQHETKLVVRIIVVRKYYL